MSDPSYGHGQELPTIDISERGAPKQGQPQTLDRRLFMQLLVFHCGDGAHPEQMVSTLGNYVSGQGVGTVVYEDVNHPKGIGLLTWSEDPSVFVGPVRRAVNSVDAGALKLVPEYTMIGRSYSTGFEQDLEEWLIERPIRTALNAAWPWAVWYPLRRSGAFMKLDAKEQGAIMREHGTIGRAYGSQDLGHDIRLACHGLDANDNEFLLGLVGKDLYPLSHLVQAMRKTRQTSEFIVQMGPFFVGRAVFRSKGR